MKIWDQVTTKQMLEISSHGPVLTVRVECSFGTHFGGVWTITQGSNDAAG